MTAAIQVTVFLLRPTIAYQALALGASPAELGLIVASFSVFSLVLAIPVGRGIDKRGERGYLLGGTILLVLAVVALAAATQLWILAIGSAVLGLSQMLSMIAIQTIIANGQEAVRRDRRFASFTLVTSASQFTAPAAAGLLISASTLRSSSLAGGLLMVYVPAAAAAVLSLAAGASLRWRPGTLADRPQHFGKAAPGALGEVFRTRSVVVALVVGFCVLSANDLLVAFMPAYGEINGYPPSVIGILIATFGLASVASRIVLIAVSRRCSRTTILALGLGCAAAGFAAIPVVGGVPALLVVMTVSGAAVGVCQPVAMAWVAASVRPEVRGTATSVRMTGNRLGQTLVPLGVASLAGAAGIAVAFLGPAGLLLGAAVLVLWARPPHAGISQPDSSPASTSLDPWH